MRLEQAFWALLTGAALLWYSVVTVYVAIRGARDIRDMIRRLGRTSEEPASDRKHVGQVGEE